jgi:hypothetical protein
MNIDKKILKEYYDALDPQTRTDLDASVHSIVSAKERGGRVMVVTGSGPNIHVGVTTLIAELIRNGIVDGVTTSSAVIAHEMDPESSYLPRGAVFEFSVLNDEQLASLRTEMVLDEELLKKGRSVSAPVIIKAAGNMAYPMGLRTENLSTEVLTLARSTGSHLNRSPGRALILGR